MNDFSAARAKFSKDVIIFEIMSKSSEKILIHFFPINFAQKTIKKGDSVISYFETARSTLRSCLGAEGPRGGAAVTLTATGRLK